MELLATTAHAECNNFYTSTLPELRSKGSETVQEGGDDFYNKSQDNVGPNPDQSWVGSAEHTPQTKVLSVGEAAEKNAKVERKIFICNFLVRSMDP
jgi:hypothetical protein